MKFKNKNVLVYGLSVSGQWACKLLRKQKANVFLYDDNAEKYSNRTFNDCFVIPAINANLMWQFDCIIVSPAIPKDNPNLELARKANIKIYSELEFASLFCNNLVAITGTNGKTTTVQLVEAMLNQKHKAIACGNIGYPLSRAVLENKNSIKVAEVSSFMLEHAEEFSPKTVAVLNISQDHLIRHKTMEEYSNLKIGIFKNLKQNQFAVVDLDSNIRPTKTCATITYSQNGFADVCLKEGYIYLHQHKICAVNELKLKGKHNIQNVMCAICFASIYKVKPEKIRQALLSFKPSNFRIQNVGQAGGIKFVNDSKSTNVASTLCAVETVKGAIILLLGGSKKGIDYKKLFESLTKRVKFIVAYGEIKDELKDINHDKFLLETCQNLDEAFNLATQNAKVGDTILLSPASASYDQFKSYVERGNRFNELVKAYERENKKE